MRAPDEQPRATFPDRQTVAASIFANASNGLQGDNQRKLVNYWQGTITDIETREHDFKSHALPLARIKKVMKADEDVRMISAEAPILFAKAAEIFITELTMRAWIHAEENKRRTLQRSDIANAISRSDMFDFLIDIVPRDEFVNSVAAASNEGIETAPVAGAAGGFIGMNHGGMQGHDQQAHAQDRPETAESGYYHHNVVQREQQNNHNSTNNYHHPQAHPQQVHNSHISYEQPRYAMPHGGMGHIGPGHPTYMEHMPYPQSYPHHNGGQHPYASPYANPYAPSGPLLPSLQQQQQQHRHQPQQQQQQQQQGSTDGSRDAGSRAYGR